MVILEIPDYNGWKYGCSGLFRKTFWSCWVLVDCSASTCLWQHGFPRWYELILPLWVSPSPWPVSTNGTVAILMSQQGESFDSQVCIFYHSQKICQSLTGRGKEKAGAGFGEKSKFLFVWSVVVVVQRSSRSQEMRRNSSLMQKIDRNPTQQEVEEHINAGWRCLAERKSALHLQGMSSHCSLCTNPHETVQTAVHVLSLLKTFVSIM